MVWQVAGWARDWRKACSSPEAGCREEDRRQEGEREGGGGTGVYENRSPLVVLDLMPAVWTRIGSAYLPPAAPAGGNVVA